MIKIQTDTDPKIEKLQLDLFRTAGTAKKITCLRDLSSTMMQLSYRAIKRAHPELSERELDLLFVKLHYGKNIADRLRAYLEKTSQ